MQYLLLLHDSDGYANAADCYLYTYIACLHDWNLYHYTRVPFGLATGAQVLTRLLDRVFQDLKFDFVTIT
jgi:hypothetical protein